MLKRMIPCSGEMIPAIGLGTWQQFDVDITSDVVPDLVEILNMMKTSGATMIDSSPMYGRSEQVVGELTSQTDADSFFYATKVWTTGREQGIDQMEDSMRKMKRQTMDLMQIHNLLDLNTHLKTLREWKEQGRIRYLGITHYQASAHEQLEEIIRSEPLDFVQFNYSIQTRNAEQTLLPLCMDKGVAVIINEPLEKGALFYEVKEKELPGWALEAGLRNWSSFFLKYILAHPAVTCVIPGTSNTKHMADILSAGVGELPDESIRKKMVEFFEG
jgi:diketogulonate reductase-like aldo/keto reductase